MPAATRMMETMMIAFALAACARRGAVTLDADRSVITAPELVNSGAAHAHEAVQRLGPDYLRTRGPSSVLNPTAMGPAVFVDGVFLGGLDVLADIPIGELARIKYFSAWDATTRFGAGYANGVIELTTKRGGQ
jgi:hypothetical protein